MLFDHDPPGLEIPEPALDLGQGDIEIDDET